MTIHSAKGLEFKHVSIVGVEEDLFPSYLSANNPKEMEEERRLFYVAVTRAGESVSLSFANTRYKWGLLEYCRPSRFISEISEEFLELPVAYEPNKPVNAGRNSFELNSHSHTRPEHQHPGYLKEKRMLKVTPVNETGSAPASDPAHILVGTRVEHQRFGTGTVCALEGDKATVDFGQQGKKQLLLKFAKLKIVN